MTSAEKGTWVVLVTLVVVYGYYFTKIIAESIATPIGEIDYQAPLVLMVLLFILVVIVGHVLLAIANRGLDVSDERDRRIDRFGEYIGGFVMGTGLLVTLGLAMAEVEYFWIAHTVLGVLVIAEAVTSAVKIVMYRRGFWVGSEDSGYELG